MKKPKRKTEIYGPGNGCLWQPEEGWPLAWGGTCGYRWIQMDERQPEEIYNVCPNCGHPLTVMGALPAGITLLSIHEVDYEK